MIFVFGLAVNAVADLPATQPNVSRMSPKEIILFFDGLDSVNIDQLMGTYQMSGADQIMIGKSLAEFDSEMLKLMKSVRDKWGKDAETAVVRSCQQSTVQDDQDAKETIDGDRATVKYKRDELPVIPFIRADGQWKLDVGRLVEQSGQSPSQFTSGVLQSTVIIKSTATSLVQGKYSSVDQLVKEIGDRLAKIQ
jgi:hypothetical protein